MIDELEENFMKQLKSEKENASARNSADREKISMLTSHLQDTTLKHNQLEAKLIIAEAQIETMKKQRLIKDTTLDEDLFTEMNYVLIKNFEALKQNSSNLMQVKSQDQIRHYSIKLNQAI